MKDKLREVLGDILNIKTEYIEKGHCAMCGFPMDMRVRKKKLDQAEAQLKKIFLERVGNNQIPEETDFDKGYNQRGQEIRKRVMG